MLDRGNRIWLCLGWIEWANGRGPRITHESRAMCTTHFVILEVGNVGASLGTEVGMPKAG